jgi:hypothetical protein
LIFSKAFDHFLLPAPLWQAFLSLWRAFIFEKIKKWNAELKRYR